MKNEVKISIGDIILLIKVNDKTIRNRVKEFFSKFLISKKKKPDIKIKVNKENFQPSEFKNLKYEYEGMNWKFGKRNKKYYIYFPSNIKTKNSLAWIDYNSKSVNLLTNDHEGQVLLYLLPELLFSWFTVDFQSVLLHASCVVIRKKPYLFVGKTGSGKSSMVRLYKRNKIVLNDDKILLKRKKDKLFVYGTPWHGELEEFSSKAFELNKIFFLKKSKTNEIIPFSNRGSLLEIFKNCQYVIWDKKCIKKNLFLCCNIIEKTPCYELDFELKSSIWRLIEKI